MCPDPSWTFVLTLLLGLAAALLIALLVCEREHTPQPHAPFWGGLKGLPPDFHRYLVGVVVLGGADDTSTVLPISDQAWAQVGQASRSAPLLLCCGANEATGLHACDKDQRRQK